MPLHDPSLAFVPYPDVAVARAATGPLSDLSFGVKDIYDVAGYPTGSGSPHLLAMSGIKTHTAPAVQTLLDAGARFIGKTVTDEFAFSMNGKNAHFGAPINGAAKDRVTGGSSCGSASAVSSGACDFAIGSDTGGSVRAPASHCNLFGIRVTHGRVPLGGALELAPSFDAFGWFARDAHTFSAVGEVLLHADPAPLPKTIRLLWPQDVWSLVEVPARPALEATARKVSATIGEALPIAQVALEDWDAMYWGFRYVQGREAWLSHGPVIERYAPPLGPGVAERFAWSRTVTDQQVGAARAFRARFREKLKSLLGDDGVLLMPTLPDVAPLRTTSDDSLEAYRNKALCMLCIASLAGVPQVSMPLASRDGVPLGISLVGPAGADRSLIALAHAAAR
ncbi:amidase [Reyranella sp. CPCC 100927]|uniref:amidase n=1 Tax=Reyranella sp. CPCC 100927 TaxID=2599616 RepID=UPI0011B3BB48|nr:amidase [Reyranella sp. CPCC 100927]TWT11648.1 amidase [Reyranella sp. CPCC 100927]